MQAKLPVIDDYGSWAKEPARILDKRMLMHGHTTVTEVLIEWANSFLEDATWEPFQQIKDDFPRIDP